MRFHVYTSVMMRTGNKYYRLWVMSQCPAVVAEYLQCGPKTEYDITQLLTTLDLNVSQYPNIQGQITAVICYHTSYLVHDKGLHILSFVLGDEISFSALDLPILLAMGTTIDLQRNILACSILQYTFVLQLDPPGNGLLDGVSLDASKSVIQLGVRSNISSATSSLQFITMDCFDFPVCQATPSNGIVVHDQFFQDRITRVLTYTLSSLPTFT